MTTCNTHGLPSSRLPLSTAQYAVWVAQRLDRQNPRYNCGGYLELLGELDVARLTAAVRRAVAETEALRVRFVEDEGGVWQVPDTEIEGELELIDPTLMWDHPTIDALTRVITEKERAPGADLLGRLISDPARQVSHPEFVGLAALLLLAGYDTMAQVIGLGTVTLLLHPDQLTEFLTKPELGENMVEEMVRYLTVNHAGLPRVAVADVEISGQLIRAGEGVLVMLNAGNRDEAAFQNPDAFDIHRDVHHHVGFGHGLHKCIGAPFARAELEIVFCTLFRRIPTLRLLQPVEELPFRHEMVLYGLHALSVGW
ncbi:MAG TPA: cytochrome P450 [Polyangiaceae bacterium]|nr:cytochrome P450 [Polyangiaceae bacterium]